jgi:hypothetical protein
MKATTLLFALAVLAFGALRPDAAQAQTVNNGTYTLNLTITLTTAVPQGDSVICSLTVSDVSATFAQDNTETATGTATVNAGTGTCVINIPYRWNPQNAATDTISYVYTAAIVSPTSPGVVIRQGTHTLPSTIGVPPPSTHTVLTQSTRL